MLPMPPMFGSDCAAAQTFSDAASIAEDTRSITRNCFRGLGRRA